MLYGCHAHGLKLHTYLSRRCLLANHRQDLPSFFSVSYSTVYAQSAGRRCALPTDRTAPKAKAYVYCEPKKRTLTAGKRLSCLTTTAASKQKVVVITGPTAVGKTSLSLSLAEAIGGEIISADSVQVYKGLDIGSAKISLEERRSIPHHLLDIIEPQEEFSAGHFFERARAATEEILQRGKVPIVVGGTGFYLRWFIHGKPTTPFSTPEGAAKAREFLEQKKAAATEKKGELNDSQLWEVYSDAVEELGDRESADRLRGELNNHYRLLRVVEILLVSAKPLAALDHNRDAPLDYDFRCFFMNRPRMELYDRIGLRCEQMLQNGLLKEAHWLQSLGLKANTHCATKAIGYRQALEFLEEQDSSAATSRQQLLHLTQCIQAKSRNLCHHQLSWFRDEPLFAWIDASQDQEALVADIKSRIDSDHHTGNQLDGNKLTKDEAKALRGYVYRQQLVCQPNIQDAILANLN